MPFTGGLSPSPERYGGAPGKAPRLQRIFESISAGRGTAYDQTLNSAVGAENIAIARAIEFDGYGANERLANNFLPARMTAVGLLPRWERILGLTPLPTDTEPVRRARVQAAVALFGTNGSDQPIRDALSAALGPVYVALEYSDITNDLAFYPGNSGLTAKIIGASSSSVTVTNLGIANTGWYGALITLSNCTNANNNGTFQINGVSGVPNTVAAYDPAGGTSPDNGIGGTSGNPTIVWSVSVPAPGINFTSSIARVIVHVTQPATYSTAQFYTAVGLIAPILDEMLPAWATWDWYIFSSAGVRSFKLDEKNLDREAFGT